MVLNIRKEKAEKFVPILQKMAVSNGINDMELSMLDKETPELLISLPDTSTNRQFIEKLKKHIVLKFILEGRDSVILSHITGTHLEGELSENDIRELLEKENLNLNQLAYLKENHLILFDSVISVKYVPIQEVSLSDLDEDLIEETDENIDDIVLMYSKVVSEKLNIVLLDSFVREILGKKYKNVENFKNNILPRLSNAIDFKVKVIKDEVFVNLINMGKYPNDVIKREIELASKQIFNKISKSELVMLVRESDRLPGFSSVINKYVEFVKERLEMRMLVGNASGKIELLEELLTRYTSENYVLLNLGKVLYEMDIIEKNELLNKTQLKTLHKEIKTSFDKSVKEKLASKDNAMVVATYELLMGGK